MWLGNHSSLRHGQVQLNWCASLSSSRSLSRAGQQFTGLRRCSGGGSGYGIVMVHPSTSTISCGWQKWWIEIWIESAADCVNSTRVFTRTCLWLPSALKCEYLQSACGCPKPCKSLVAKMISMQNAESNFMKETSFLSFMKSPFESELMNGARGWWWRHCGQCAQSWWWWKQYTGSSWAETRLNGVKSKRTRILGNLAFIWLERAIVLGTMSMLKKYPTIKVQFYRSPISPCHRKWSKIGIEVKFGATVASTFCSEQPAIETTTSINIRIELCGVCTTFSVWNGVFRAMWSVCEAIIASEGRTTK